MTSLKAKYSNEIAEEMERLLNNKEFVGIFNKTASLDKEAGSALEAYKKDLEAAKDEAAVKAAWTKHTSALEAEENKEEGAISAAKKAQAAKAKSLQLPGYSVPMANDGQHAEDEGCVSADCSEGLMAKDTCPECCKTECQCSKEEKAAEFTLNNLIKIADALDGRGFNTLANMVDDVITKVSKKKEKLEESGKDKEKEDKKKEKEDKKKEKEEKEKEDKKEKKDKKKEKDEKKDKE